MEEALHGREEDAPPRGIPPVGQCAQVDIKTDLSDMSKQCKIYMARNKPVLFKKAAAHWPCATKWKLDWFKSNDPVGDVEIEVSLDGKEGGPKQKMSVRNYVAGFGSCGTGSVPALAGEAPAGHAREDESADGQVAAHAAPEGRDTARGFMPYMRAWFFSDDCPEMLEDFPNPPPEFPDKFKGVEREFQPPFTWIFLGPTGAFSPLHRDIWFTCAWMAQLEGRKRFVFYSPADLKYVYHKDAAGTEVYADPRDPDLTQFPDFRKATPIEAVLEAGDVVYIPSKWPHYVECLTPSVSLTSNFANVVNFKHVLVPYTRWLERRRAVLEMVKAVKALAGKAPEGKVPEGLAAALGSRDAARAPEGSGEAGAAGDGESEGQGGQAAAK